ncbi:chemotaxis protein MotB [Litoreibacter halocynthiae]|uniref:Chemotaxis protein MotB n=1 Tax=Litoreibacter halocynthiae TaxID=1242689 RepID=A0A4R7LKS5_9RHOB|nr:peptidoglycan -binding protein [Litoreibacter halocynthiae]TDT75296.1 chemotaxis protein MotB [Litoreibacter halocynthiae]
MALSRRNGKRFEANIWPGFVDAMTALLLVLVFVLSIFMIVQFMLSETITSQDSELDQLTSEVSSLAEALGLEQQRSFGLEQNIDELDAQAAQQAALIASLSAQNNTQAGRIASFEEQVAGLLKDREGLQNQVASLSGDLDASQTQVAGLSARIEDIEAGLAREISEKEAAQLALAAAREEISEGEEAARLAAARREALEALVADLEVQSNEQADALDAAEAAKLVDAAAAQALRDRLKNADAELTAMTLALEAQRKEAEDTLTLLAAARAAEKALQEELSSSRTSALTLEEKLAAALAAKTDTSANLAAAETAQESLREQLMAALAAKVAAESGAGEALSVAEQRAALLDAARDELADQKAISLDSQRKVEALNQQVAALRSQLGSLQAILDETDTRREAADVQVQNLGSELNSALALVASEQRARAKLEEAERLRLEAEAKELKNYRSEFFGQLRALLGNQDGIRIEGDRFVFSSEVLFRPGQAVLSPAGKGEVAKVAAILSRVAGDIPDTLDWVIRVDGHTDNVPLSGFGQFKDNWELSQARALSVVRYMSADLGIPPARLAANGFGEYQPINEADTPEARAQNRRIELKLTEK